MGRSTEEQDKFRKELMETVLKCKDSPSLFAKKFLGYTPYDYNALYLDAPDKWIVYRAGRKVGKTMSTAAKVLHFAWFAPFMQKTVQDRCEIVIVAPTQNQANIMFDMIKTLVNRSDVLKQYVVKSKADEMWVKFINGAGLTKIYTRASGDRGDSIRGYVPHVIIVDEVAFVKRQVLTALIPAGIATDARVWLTSTPFSKSGYFYEACLNARAGTKSLIAKGWHKEGGRWIQFHVSSLENPLVAENMDALEELKTLTKDEYRLEVLGEFAEAGNSLIPRELIVQATGNYKLPVGVRHVIGVDVARSGKDETVFIVLAVDEQNNVFVRQTYSEESSTMVNVVGKVGELCRKYHDTLDVVYMDETGLGAGAVDLALANNLPVRGVVFTLQEKERMYNTLVTLFENGRIKLGDGGKLAYQLSYLQKDYTPNNNLRIISEEHDDFPDALALGCKAVYSGDSWHMLESKDEHGEIIPFDSLL